MAGPPRFLVATALLLLLLSPAAAAAGESPPGLAPADLFPGATFDPSIPSPERFLGLKIGERPVRHDELLRYLEALDTASPRAKLTTYTTSHEGRRLVYLAVGDAATIARLDEFRGEHAARVDPRDRPAAKDAARLEGAPAVAWMAYGIHGDELSSVDAAMALAYWLVAGEDERARSLRRELLVLIDPMENPDGRERYLAQTTAFAHATPNPDGEDLSHTTVWPWGRGNHYLFDLNRDWFSMVQPESRRSAVIAAWNPQLMVDSHEMGANDSYLFSPPRHPFNPHLASTLQDWSERFGNDQAAALDDYAFPYYTREWNEEFFPGYGSSWASYRGAVGILYEMSRTSGTLVRKQSGLLRSYPEAVRHQVTSSVANLTTLATHRAEVLRDFVAGRRAAIEAARRGPVGSWVLPRGWYPARSDALAKLLREQGIEVLYAASLDGLSAELHDIRTGERGAPGPHDGAWVVPLDQSAAPLVRNLLDPHVPMETTFLREQREYLERGKGSRLYEITAWSLPLLYGIEAYWTKPVLRAGLQEGPPPARAAAVEQAGPVFGYLIDGRSDAASGALADLLGQGLSVRLAGKPFTLHGTRYGPGSLLLAREENPDGLVEALAAVAARRGVDVRAARTAKAEAGPDLGGRHFHPLVAPRVGVFSGYPVSPSDYGAIWHLLDEEAGLRFSGLDLGRFAGTDLRRYNVLVFPPAFGGSGAYERMLGPSGLERLRRWIEEGGTAVGVGSGAEFLAAKENRLTKTRLRREALERFPPVVVGIDAVDAERAGPFRSVGLRPAPEPAGEDAPAKEKKSPPPQKQAPRESPYDVAPLLGPGARPFAAGHDQGTPVAMTPVALGEWLKPLLAPGKTAPDEAQLAEADARLRRFSPNGALLRLDLDPDVWLTWGIVGEPAALIRARDTFVAEPPVQVAAQFAELDRLHLGGLLWPEAGGRIARTAYATREALGRGQVILFLDAPEFRGWTLGTRRLLLNALLTGPGMGTRWATPW